MTTLIRQFPCCLIKTHFTQRMVLLIMILIVIVLVVNAVDLLSLPFVDSFWNGITDPVERELRKAILGFVAPAYCEFKSEYTNSSPPNPDDDDDEEIRRAIYTLQYDDFEYSIQLSILLELLRLAVDKGVLTEEEAQQQWHNWERAYKRCLNESHLDSLRYIRQSEAELEERIYSKPEKPSNFKQK